MELIKQQMAFGIKCAEHAYDLLLYVITKLDQAHIAKAIAELQKLVREDAPAIETAVDALNPVLGAELTAGLNAAEKVIDNSAAIANTVSNVVNTVENAGNASTSAGTASQAGTAGVVVNQNGNADGSVIA